MGAIIKKSKDKQMQRGKKMTNEQKKRLEEALEKYNKTADAPLGMWSVEQMIGDTSNRMRVESTIRAIEKMAKENE
jgi:membrane-bound lytic murein transglycosylase B